MIRLCIDARMLGFSGIGRYLKNVIFNLDPKIFDLTLILDHKIISDIGHNYDPKIDLNNFKNKIFVNFSIYSLKEQFFLPFKISSCDLFWTPHFNVPIFPIKAKKRVVTIHDLYHLAYFNKLNFKEKIYSKIFYTQAIKRSDAVITVSNFSKSEILKFFPKAEKKISIISNCIDPKFDISNNIREIKQKFDLKNEFFLFVGNFKEHKNLNLLIKSFSIFLKKNDQMDLILIGKRAFHNFLDIESSIKKERIEKRVKIINDLADHYLPTFYYLSKALIFPSIYEGFGLPLLEAMSMKTAVIASDISVHREVCGDSVYYFNPHDPLQLVEAMEKMLNDGIRQKYIKLGLERKELFSLKKCVNLHQNLFMELCR